MIKLPRKIFRCPFNWKKANKEENIEGCVISYTYFKYKLDGKNNLYVHKFYSAYSLIRIYALISYFNDDEKS